MPSTRFILDRMDGLLAAARAGDLKLAKTEFSFLRTELQHHGAMDWLAGATSRNADIASALRLVGESAPLSLVQAESSAIFGERAYILRDGRRHHVRAADLLASYGMLWPDDLRRIPEAELLQYRVAQRLPERWPIEAFQSPPPGLASWQMRELIGAQLAGHGVEVGALAAPFPADIGCDVTYADPLAHEQLSKKFPDEPEHDFVTPTILTTIDELSGIADDSLDFLIACHVIEHTPNPIRAIERAFTVLRPGGRLVLVVPDKARSFDRARPLTELQHLIDDFERPSRERDAEHYREFFRVAFPQHERANWQHAWERQQSIHFHVWSYESFMELIEWCRRNVALFASVWSHPTPANESDFEFYCVLTK